MKRIAGVAPLLFLVMTSASAQTLDDLQNDGKNTDNVLTYGMGYHQRRYSPLPADHILIYFLLKMRCYI